MGDTWPVWYDSVDRFNRKRSKYSSQYNFSGDLFEFPTELYIAWMLMWIKKNKEVQRTYCSNTGKMFPSVYSKKKKTSACNNKNRTWQYAVNECFGWYLHDLILPFLSKMLSGNLQNQKGLFPQICRWAIYNEKQRRYAAGHRREPQNCLEISGDTQCKTSSSQFQKRTWKESKSVWSNNRRIETLKDVSHNKTESEKYSWQISNPLGEKRRA